MLLLASQGNAASRPVRGVMTWYSFEDNESNIGSFDNTLVAFKSVARSHGSSLRPRDKVYIPLLKGFPLHNGKKHGGWVRVDDECRGNACKFLDLYVGSEIQKERYRKWMRQKCSCDPDQLHIIARM
jgi:hypothetical protein